MTEKGRVIYTGRKVLIISSSPRKGGNTDMLCDRFADGAREAGNDVEKIRLSDCSISFCRGCETCIKSGKCVIKDDAPDIAQRMTDADVIVLSSPVYFYTIDAQMKALIDRTVPFYQRMTGKSFYYIVAAADPDPDMLELAVECFRGFARDCIEDAVEMGCLKATGVWAKGEVADKPFMDTAYRMGLSV